MSTMPQDVAPEDPSIPRGPQPPPWAISEDYVSPWKQRVTGGWRGSPGDRLVGAFNRNVFDPARRKFQETMRGDAMSGDLSLQDMAASRPAKALVRGGEMAADAFRGLESFANRNVPRVERGIRNFMRQF